MYFFFSWFIGSSHLVYLMLVVMIWYASSRCDVQFAFAHLELKFIESIGQNKQSQSVFPRSRATSFRHRSTFFYSFSVLMCISIVELDTWIGASAGLRSICAFCILDWVNATFSINIVSFPECPHVQRSVLIFTALILCTYWCLTASSLYNQVSLHLSSTEICAQVWSYMCLSFLSMLLL